MALAAAPSSSIKFEELWDEIQGHFPRDHSKYIMGL